jgi:hypothetical protein
VAPLGVIFLASLLITLSGSTSHFLYGAPASFKFLLTIPVVMLAAVAAAIVCMAKGWRGSAARMGTRIHQVLVLGGVAALAWFAW